MKTKPQLIKNNNNNKKKSEKKRTRSTKRSKCSETSALVSPAATFSK